MTLNKLEIALTLFLGKHSIAPESSDGFASVGTILPKEKAALLPGGLFVSDRPLFCAISRYSSTSKTHSLRDRAASLQPALCIDERTRDTILSKRPSGTRCADRVITAQKNKLESGHDR
jgi:hypothetical protein